VAQKNPFACYVNFRIERRKSLGRADFVAFRPLGMIRPTGRAMTDTSLNRSKLRAPARTGPGSVGGRFKMQLRVALLWPSECNFRPRRLSKSARSGVWWSAETRRDGGDLWRRSLQSAVLWSSLAVPSNPN